MAIRQLTRSDGTLIPEPTSHDRLLAFERSLGEGVTLPPGFRSFILQYNGGRFKENILFTSPIGPVIACDFLFLTGDRASIEKAIIYSFDEISRDIVPFCSDPGGNYFFLGYKSENWNQVYFWDHETREVTLLTDSFEVFINSLEEDRE